MSQRSERTNTCEIEMNRRDIEVADKQTQIFGMKRRNNTISYLGLTIGLRCEELKLFEQHYALLGWAFLHALLCGYIHEDMWERDRVENKAWDWIAFSNRVWVCPYKSTNGSRAHTGSFASQTCPLDVQDLTYTQEASLHMIANAHIGQHSCLEENTNINRGIQSYLHL